MPKLLPCYAIWLAFVFEKSEKKTQKLKKKVFEFILVYFPEVIPELQLDAVIMRSDIKYTQI